MNRSARICYFDPDSDGLSVSDAFGDLCALFCESAASVWNDLRDTRDRGSALSEDSITDYLLLDMSRRSPQLAYYRYTRYAESHKSGADWLWLFISGGRGFPLLVQAKRLYGSEEYEALEHTPKKKRDQLNLLERHARRSGFYPLVCFYNYWQSPQAWAAAKFSGDERLWGCAIARVRDVKKALGAGKGRSLGALGPLSMPWHALACPGAETAAGLGSTQLPDRVRERIVSIFGRQGVPEVREGLPRNIRELIASAPQSLDIAGDLRESLAGIVVVGDDIDSSQ